MKAPKSIVERIQAKADVIARRHADDVRDIMLFTTDDPEDENFGKIMIDVNEWGGPKMRGGRIVGDHDAYFAIQELKAFIKTLGASLEFDGDGDGDGCKIFSFVVNWKV